jgi:branched-subunit amino acid transport protein
MEFSSEQAITLAILAAALGTYFWRGLGVWVANRVDTSKPLFVWITCVAYAILAGLITRVIVFPVGILESTHFWQRILGLILAIGIYLLLKRNMLIGILAGASSLPLLKLVS